MGHNNTETHNRKMLLKEILMILGFLRLLNPYYTFQFVTSSKY